MRTHEREIKKKHRTAHNIWLTKKEVNEGIFIYIFIDKHNLEYHNTLGYHRICQKYNLIDIYTIDFEYIFNTNLN